MFKKTESQGRSKTAIIAWCLYDWAGSSFSIIVTTFIFATYFTTKIAPNVIEGTHQWANATAIAGLVVAISSPMFGAIADHAGYHKIWLFCFTLLAIISSALLWFAYPNEGSLYYTLICVVVGTIGFEIALVFYNTFLGALAPKQYLGRISGWGWGSGYLGGIVALTIALFLLVNPHITWFDQKTAEHIRICGPFVALWYTVFSLPLFFLVPQIGSAPVSLKKAIGLGMKELQSTLKYLAKEKNILVYLISHMIYTDGLNTLFAFGGIYAAGTYGLNFQEVLLFGITMNISAGIGAISLGWMDDYLGSKATILCSLCFLILFGIPILFLHDKFIFWCVALLLCLFVGPSQSASRTLMVRLIEGKRWSTEMFGLYSLSGRITAFIGPWALGSLTNYFNSQRVGMVSILIFFAIGALILLPVTLTKKDNESEFKVY